MPLVSNFNKIKIATLTQRRMSQTEISIDLGIPKSTISSILQKLRQIGTTERRQGSGRPSIRVSTDQVLILNFIHFII
jgi:DNA-binding IclR family transcriptional regulator